MQNNIEELVREELTDNDQTAANKLVEYLNDNSMDENLKQTALNKVNKCVHCGSCSGGKSKVVFGKEIDAVCGCTFRFDNPQMSDLPLIEYMIEAMVKQRNESNFFDVIGS